MRPEKSGVFPQGNRASLNPTPYQPGRDAVMDAALRLFSGKGFAGTSVQDLANELGFKKGSLYYYIDSKESLLREILVDFEDEADSVLAAAASRGGPATQRLWHVLGTYATWICDNAARAAVHHGEGRYADGELRRLLDEGHERRVRSLATLVEEAQRSSRACADTCPRTTARFVLDAFAGIPDHLASSGRCGRDIVAAYVELAMSACVLGEACCSECAS